MPLALTNDHLAEIYAQSRASYPLECCGALIGRLNGGQKTVLRVEPLTNAEPDAPERRFVIDPMAQIRLERAASAEGLSVIGFYHSHPDSLAKPSSTDLEWAWPVYSYMIVSVQRGEVADLHSYELADDISESKQFFEETISVV